MRPALTLAIEVLVVSVTRAVVRFLLHRNLLVIFLSEPAAPGVVAIVWRRARVAATVTVRRTSGSGRRVWLIPRVSGATELVLLLLDGLKGFFLLATLFAAVVLEAHHGEHAA